MCIPALFPILSPVKIKFCLANKSEGAQIAGLGKQAVSFKSSSDAATPKACFHFELKRNKIKLKWEEQMQNLLVPENVTEVAHNRLFRNCIVWKFLL